MHAALAPYIPAREGPWDKIVTADAQAKAELVASEIEAMGETREVAEFAAKRFVWSCGYIDRGPSEGSLEMDANFAIRRWAEAKVQGDDPLSAGTPYGRAA